MDFIRYRDKNVSGKALLLWKELGLIAKLNLS
jgi:hypothetical protein